LPNRASHFLEMAEHPRRIRVAVGKEPKGAHGLEDRHAAAGHGAAFTGSSLTQEFGLEREIDEILSANSEGWRQRSKAGHARLGARPSVQPVYDPQDVHRSRRTHLLEAGLQEPDIPAPAHSESPHTL
jgi:hypothetical protein